MGKTTVATKKLHIYLLQEKLVLLYCKNLFILINLRKKLVSWSNRKNRL